MLRDRRIKKEKISPKRVQNRTVSQVGKRNNHRRRNCEPYYLVNYLITDEKHNLYPIIIASTNQPFNEVIVRRHSASKS
jgi:hypothetical protein